MMLFLRYSRRQTNIKTMKHTQEQRLALLAQTEEILADVKNNIAVLAKCLGPHNFSICLDRHTREPIDGAPTQAQSFGAWWRCSKCGGRVESLHKFWYEKGVHHGKIEMAWQVHKTAGRGVTVNEVSDTIKVLSLAAREELEKSLIEAYKPASVEQLRKVIASVPVLKEFICPQCRNPLKPVEYPDDSMFNKEQWGSQVAGDFYCDHCHSDKARTGYLYFWKKDLP
jgi:Zn finger protein HypA/HybF involved in hydrogenase expression